MVTKSTTSRVTRPTTSAVTGVGVSGGSGEEPASLLLDLVTNAEVAFGLRKLRNAYSGSAIRVRRSSDSAEQDIGFDGSGTLDTASLLTFCGAGSGFVVTWYDQSGNGRNATQATTTRQPSIVSTGSLITVNSLPAIRFDSDWLDFTSLTAGSVFAIFKRDVFNTANYLIGGNSQGIFSGGSSGSVTGPGMVNGSFIQDTVEDTDPHILTALSAASPDAVRVDGLQKATGTISTLSLSRIGSRSDLTGILDARDCIGEIVIWSADQSSSLSTIEGNMNTHWSIY